MTQNREQVLATQVVAWLKDEGWEVYQEVTTAVGRCDIVAVKGIIRWAIEVKTSLNMVVLDQARQNGAWFHFSSIAVPQPLGAMGRSWDFAKDVSKLYGFGMLAIWPSGDIRPVTEGRLNRRPGRVTLVEEQKTALAAGSTSGGHWTPFRQTTRNLTRYVRIRPGISLKEAVSMISHHYSSVPSATQSLADLIRRKVIVDVVLRNGLLYLSDDGN